MAVSNVVVNGRLLLAGPFHLELGGNVRRSQVFRFQTRVLCNARQHPRPDFDAIVNAKTKSGQPGRERVL